MEEAEIKKEEKKTKSSKKVVENNGDLIEELSKRSDVKYFVDVKNKKVYPRIICGMCEFCGTEAKHCEHYKEMWEQGLVRCICGNPESAPEKVVYLYVPHRKVFICDTLSCMETYKNVFGGFEDKVFLHFYGFIPPKH